MKISLLGAHTLKRFTEGILRDGLEGWGCVVSLNCAECDYGIIKIHGSPVARDADLDIIRDIRRHAPRLAGCVILLHRPDEIKDSIPQLKAILSVLPPAVGLAMLGDLLSAKADGRICGRCPGGGFISHFCVDSS